MQPVRNLQCGGRAHTNMAGAQTTTHDIEVLNFERAFDNKNMRNYPPRLVELLSVSKTRGPQTAQIYQKLEESKALKLLKNFVRQGPEYWAPGAVTTGARYTPIRRPLAPWQIRQCTVH